MCAPVRPRPCVRGSFGAGSVMSVIGPPKAYEKRAIRVRGVCHGSVMRPPEVCHAPPDSLPSGPGASRRCLVALAGDGRTFTTSRAAGARCRPVRSEGRARSWTRAAPTSRPCDRRSDVAHHEARSATPPRAERPHEAELPGPPRERAPWTAGEVARDGGRCQGAPRRSWTPGPPREPRRDHRRAGEALPRGPVTLSRWQGAPRRSWTSEPSSWTPGPVRWGP